MLTHIFLVLFTAVYAVVCLLLILAVLMQRSKQDGIGAAFGSGITDSMFGAQTSSVLVKFTSWLTALFFILSIVLAQFYGQSHSEVSPVQQELKAAAAATPTTPEPVAPPSAPTPVTPAPTVPAK